ncbi:hypothetical protein SAMN02745126_01021 [Enhydrobacter aerosaccus]|uniref:DUF2066 domain-containing protein n=1 Tax=Enhydrobacter aerosaccus TaxID=225324 RepID=A0A1T4KKU7_9HYPH|nr:DUF2066 domain-containing protein [Enhydrobacter aerosaccus]SJZ43039.1 hypothetical protein SAMN02745126_01021 [Enhydrobacter aerosaccus]
MPPARWFSTILVILLAAVAVSGAARAQIASNNTYTIPGVEVDIDGADAVKARDQGILEAERRAAKMLVDKMVAPDDRSKVPPLDDARLQTMVRGVEFARERAAGNHYQATLNVVFAAAPVKAWLQEAGVGIAETIARPALLVPLWKDRDGVEPLDDHNAWRDAWQALDTSSSAVPLTVVRGDQLDQNALSVEEAYVGDVSALSRLNERYHAPTIIVATVEGDKNGGPLTVSGMRYDTQTGARTDLAKATVDNAQGLGDAAKKMHAALEEQWRSIAVVRRDSQASLEVTVPIRTLSDWVQIRQRLGSVPAVKNVAVRTLESDHADLRLDYYGTPEQLQQTLTQVGLQLDRDGDQWRLQAR